MAFLNGIGFFIIFLIQFILTLLWINKFKLYQCYKPNTVSFHFYARWFLSLLPLMAGFDNLRLFAGSFISESFAASTFSENYFHFVSFLHFVLLSLLLIECAIFITTPKIKPINISSEDNMIYHQHSSKCNSCIWCFTLIVTFLLFSIGMYAFITLSKHSIFDDEYGIYHWKTDENYIENEINFLQIIGVQQPVFASIFTLIMNIIIWKRYRYWLPFLITLISIICIGSLVASWNAGFFFIGNFFEFTLFLSFYKLDTFMYWMDEKEQSTYDQSQKYYEF